MGIFKKVKKTVSKGAKAGARSVVGEAKTVYKKTAGKGVRTTPTFKQITRALKRISPVRGFIKTTKTLKGPAPRKSRGSPRRR